MSVNPALEVRQMSREELSDIAIEMAAGEGWNPGLYDASAFYAADQNGFFVGTLEGKPIACISIVKYSEDFAFLGFYIVRQQYRGKGYGLSLWNTALKSLTDQNIGLDGVPDQQANYEKSGFHFQYSNIRFEGKAEYSADIPQSVVPLNLIPFEKLTAYDRQCFPAGRETFLEKWISLPSGTALAYVKNDELKGYTVLRKCRNGYKIAPLFADDSIIAEQLFQAVCNFAGQDSIIYLDVPEVNIAAMNMTKKYGMLEVFRTARMYTEQAPNIDLNKVFGVTSFELG